MLRTPLFRQGAPRMLVNAPLITTLRLRHIVFVQRGGRSAELAGQVIPVTMIHSEDAAGTMHAVGMVGRN